MVVTAFLLTLALLPLVHVPSFEATAPTFMTSSMSYEYHFSEPFVDLTSADRLFRIEGSDLDPRGGVPALPVFPVSLAVPPGQRLVDLVLSHSAPRMIELMTAYPTNPVEMAVDGEMAYCHEYAAEPWEATGSQVLEGVEVVGLTLRPLYWNVSTGALSFVEDFTLTLILEDVRPDYVGDMGRVREMVDNPEAVPDLLPFASSNVLPQGEYDHLIITSEALSSPFEELARWKGERDERGAVYEGVRSKVVTLEDILATKALWGSPSSHHGTGNDTQTVVRNMIVAAHREWGVDYVLIGGDDDVVPVRMVAAPIFDTEYRELPADIYYSGLDGDWDADGDGVYGELLSTFPTVRDEADLLAEVFVGRATVSTAEGAWNFVNKTMAYERGYVNQYANDILLIGERLDSAPTYGDDYKQEIFDEVLADEGLTSSTLYARDGTFSGPAVLAAMRSGVHVINHMGHGNFGSFAGVTSQDVQGLDNALPFLLYTQACMVAGFDERADDPGDCIAEEMVQGEGGAVAFIGNSRYGWYARGSTYGSSQRFDKAFFSQVYDGDVPELGRALAYSKESLYTSALSAGTMRWVYLELNLLGDPETSVHLSERATHDLEVRGIEVGRCIAGERCQVTVEVRNVGQSMDEGALRLLVDGETLGNAPVSLAPGEGMTVMMGWTPSGAGRHELVAVVACEGDESPENDRSDLEVMVDRRVTSDEHWSGEVVLSSGLLIAEGVTVTARDCHILLRSSPMLYRLTVNGAFLMDNCIYGGSPSVLDSAGGKLAMTECLMEGASLSLAQGARFGSLSLRNTSMVGGSGWQIEGANVVMTNSSAVAQEGEWLISDSTVAIDLVDGAGGHGLHLVNASGTVSRLSWTGGSSGLIVERCSGMTLHDLSFVGNAMDMDIKGDVTAHFIHDLRNVTLTAGPLAVLHGLDGTTLTGAFTSLYLVECHAVVVRGQRFQGAGTGLALIESHGIEVIGNAIENCTTGILAIGSQGTVWANDLLDNDAQVHQARSDLTFDRGYPRGGNHWSDMHGLDQMSGERQDAMGCDGIFDSPYEGGAYDRYPKVGRCSYLYDSPNASFIINAVPANRVDPVVLTHCGGSGIGIANWTWDLGDGNTAYGDRAVHTYLSLGTAPVLLTVTDHKGSTATATGEVLVVNLLPDCGFIVSPSRPAPGEAVRFEDRSSDRDGSISAWRWDFGDGGTSLEPEPEHTYQEEGEYLVSLTVMDAEGGSASTTQALAVGNDPPVATFVSAPSLITVLTDVRFTSQSHDPDGEVVSWAWSFGDGATGTGSSVVHRYSSLGTFQVTLEVWDEHGASSSVTASLTVRNSRPVADFEAPGSVLSLEEVHFVDLSYDLDGRVLGWSWDFGDGGTSTLASPAHIYKAPGDYAVTLTVMDDRRASSVKMAPVKVLNRLPQVAIEGPSGEHWSLEEMEFHAMASDMDGTVASFHWDMGDGRELEGQTVCHAYLCPGEYVVTLTCEDDAGGVANATIVVQVQNLIPLVGATYERSLDHPLELMFQSGAEDLDGSIASYDWRFGDGGSSAEAAPAHRYRRAGDYTVVLNVTDDRGAWAVAFANVTVVEGSLFLTGMTCEKADGEWVLEGTMVNEGPSLAYVTFYVNVTDGRAPLLLRMEYRLEPGERRAVEVGLGAHGEATVNATLGCEEGFDSDSRDNIWGARISDPGLNVPMGYVVVPLIGAIIAAAVVIVRRR